MGNRNKLTPLYAAKLDLLAQQTLLGIAATLVMSAPLVLLLWQVTSLALLIYWFTAVAILCGLRFINIFYYRNFPEEAINSYRWRIFFYSGISASGLLWGLSVVLLPPVENLIYLCANTFWVCAILTVTIGSYSFLKRTYLLFSVSATLPIIIYFLSNGDVYLYICVAVVISFLFTSLSAIKLYKVIDENISSTLNEKNKKLEILKQKNILHVIAETAEILLKDSWELAIPELLKKLGHAVDVSRIQIFENIYDKNLKHTTTISRYQWASESAPEYEYSMISTSYHQLKLKRWEQILSNGDYIFGNSDSFSKDEQRILKSINVKSLFSIPIFVGTDWWGFISFDECRSNRDWKTEEINVIKTSATIIGAAIKRTWDENKLSYHANHDSLTGLNNRRAFGIHLDKLIQTCEKTREAHVLCYIDLDRFKVINDTCGHNAGDHLLRQLGNVMMQSVRNFDMVSRLGGDEFAILLENISIDDAKRVIDKLQLSIEKHSFHWNEGVFRVGASFGLVAIDSSNQNADKILQTADNACRAVKQSNSSQIRIYNVDDVEMPFERSASQSYVRINHALENDDFTILFQPISKINELQEKWTHYEVLIRMLNDNNSLITPNRFLPAAERYNLVNKIDRWVFKTCIKILEENTQLLNNVNTLSVNISGASLCEPSYLKYVNSIFEQYEVAPEKICFEITETVAVSNLSEANNFISRLRDLGCKFALDDFGTGFSSFENLKYLTVDYVKIDGIFIRDLQTNKIDYEMVHSLHKIAKLMNIKTIAEYVESDETLSTLKEIGVDYVQGYAISKPLTLDQVLKANFEEKKKILRFAS